MDILNELPKAFQCEAFKKLKEVTDIASMTEEERITYENTLRNYRDAIMTIESTKNEGIEEGIEIGHARGLEEGIEIGEAKGHAKGHAEGREEGIEIGRAQEHEKVVRSARAMKSAGMSLDIIKENTGLTDEEIAAL